MNCSWNEAVSLLTKAAIAAGLDPGTAKEVATGAASQIAEESKATSRFIKLAKAGNSAALVTAYLDTPTLRPRRLKIATVHFARLESLALEACVQPSETSRLAGAGAGLTDND